MSKNAKKQLVPELRFSEFEAEGTWKEEVLNVHLDYLQPTKYLVSSTAYKDSYSTPVLTAGKTFILGYTDETDGVFSDDLPVIIFDDFTTASKFVDFPFKAKSSAMKILVARDNTNIKFIYESMQNLQYEVGVHERHWISIFSKLKIPVPKNTNEQQKIANCLSSLDELIAAHTQKHQALQSYKKGLLQNLFPAEGETVPVLRFPEFENAGDWVEAPLENVARYENGKAHEQDITKSGDFIVVNSKFISTNGEVKKYTNEAFCLAKKGDILMVLSDVPNGRAIAKCFFVDENDRYTVNQRICKLSPKKAVGIMLFYSLNRNPYFLAFDDGVKQTNLRKDDVLNFPLLLPKDFEEQQKIADCLSSLDDLISSHAQKIEDLKAHKKGLMQQLFPSVDEVGV